MAASKNLAQWLAEYNESHRHPQNKALHWLCVPAIFFSIMGLLINLNAALAVVLTLAVVLFYWRLSAALAVAMVLFMVVCWALVWLLPPGYALYWVIFVLAWIGQFVGHKLEGKKPSFFQDIQFLLIGPAWVAVTLFGFKTDVR